MRIKKKTTSTNLLIGNFLKKKRQAAKLTQKDVAKSLGLATTQMIVNIESGRAAAPIETLKRLTDLYGVDKDEMYNSILGYYYTGFQQSFKEAFYSEPPTPPPKSGVKKSARPNNNQ